jgi:hypothetical protein
MVEAMGLKKYGNEVTFNGMTSLLNFIQSTDSKVITGDIQMDIWTDRQHGDLIRLTFLFLGKQSKII